MLRFFSTLLAFALLAFTSAHAQNKTAMNDPENTLFLDTSQGRVVIALRPDLAPQHVERIKQLAREKFYDGTPFHRVIAGFMAQTGDPTGTGSGRSSYPNVIAEFSTVPFDRGIVGMARSSDINSANSQFFIMYARTPSLDGKYTVFGNVVSGMDIVDKIKKGPAEMNGAVTEPDKILKAQVASDAK